MTLSLAVLFRRTGSLVTLSFAALCVMLLPASADEPLANADFRDGQDSPASWSLSGGKGRWVDRHILEVTGSGSDNNSWRCDHRFTPGALGYFEARVRQVDGTGGAIVGPVFANRDFRGLSDQWQWQGFAFRVPDGVSSSYVRLGQWHASGAIQFDAARLFPALPVHRATGGMLLGEGESILGDEYFFRGIFNGETGNYHRTLVAATAPFNSDRWCLAGSDQVTYRFGLPGQRFLSGQVDFVVNYHTRGVCLAEVSRDGGSWQTLTKIDKKGAAKADLPASMLPAETVHLRLRGAEKSSSFQVNGVEFQGRLSNPLPDAKGQTAVAVIEPPHATLAFQEITLGGGSGEQMSLSVKAINQGSKPVTVALQGIIDQSEKVPPLERPTIAVRQTATFRIDVSSQKPGDHRLALTLDAGQEVSTTARIGFRVPDYYRCDYGKLLTCGKGNGKATLWWCEAAHKVPRQRPLPADCSEAVQLSAAKNDCEAAQIVVTPSEPLRGLTAKASAMSGPHGATIPADRVEVLRVYYHFVDHPTDRTGLRDFWPDALPPLRKPLDIPAGQNQPLWVLVRVPTDAAAGDYSGTVALRADGFSADVPVRLHVWNYALPERNHLETAFGLSVGMIWRYHQLKTEDDKRRVFDMYMENFRQHRISPYDPVPLDPFRVKFLPKANPPCAEIDFSAFDPAMERAIKKFHVTTFRLPIQGMGGGTFESRTEPRIAGFGEDTPEYQGMFASEVRQIEDHLRRKNWLQMAYIYWFDEPEPKDYAFVRKGMERLKKYAPGLRCMLTEEPGETLAGPIDIWCPVSHNYNHHMANECRKHGDILWWYVCCGPKAPFTTLFIDHPAVELRTWLWQTWQRGIVGNLVWESNYWTARTAQPQNPYEDPMGYVSTSTPEDRRYWGNGDGRFLYPPESAAVPGKSGPGPVIEPPVSSIRWEMLREGIEDYESLWLLRDLIARRRNELPADELQRLEGLLVVPASITTEMTKFSTDPSPIYAHRAAVAQAIERLSH
jgi:hypothetical protein